MRAIKLHFPDAKHLEALQNDEQFQSDIKYLNPYRLNSNSVVLFDPVTQHNPLDTEVVVLSKFANGIKRIIFPNTNYGVEFLNSSLAEQKGGLTHNNTRIIDSTDLERMEVNITVREV